MFYVLSCLFFLFDLKIKTFYLYSQIVNTNSYGNDDCAKEFGIKVANQLAVVDARVLPTPRVYNHLLFIVLFNYVLIFLLKLCASFQSRMFS